MKKRCLSILLALCLLLTLPITAMAAEGAPAIASLSIAGVSAAADDNGSLAAIVPLDTALAGKSFSMTASEAVSFVEDSAPQTGELYVADATANEVTLAFNLSSGSDGYSITMSTTNGVVWSGSFASTFDMTMGEFAQALSAAGATLKAGAMKDADGNDSAAYTFYCNQDADDVQLVVCPENAPAYDVTYWVKYDASDPVAAYTWKVPAGSVLHEPALNLTSSQTLQGWYTDAAMTQSADFSAAVTADTALYGKVTTTASGSFATDFANNEPVLTIRNSTDWTSFISLASQISSSQRVVLDTNINCGGASYSPIIFAGDFDGGNHMIMNATFTASNGNSGMFHTIGAGQKICNLTLRNITAQNAGTYAGILAGAVSGTEGNHALIQNVHVVGGSVSGRSAGGIAGFIFWADVKYCSSTGTTISGIANGGGIGGISYGFISQSYSTTSPTALTILRGTAGGITGKNLEGGSITSCWCTFDQIAGRNTDATMSYVLAEASEDSNFSTVNLDECWDINEGALPTLNKTACRYSWS